MKEGTSTTTPERNIYPGTDCKSTLSLFPDLLVQCTVYVERLCTERASSWAFSQ